MSDQFKAEVTARFGILPNFFCTAPSVPGLIEKMWGFAKSGYLDNPLPSLFKERLFVHLSRFCATRYCIVRHVGFLIGEGRPAGDAAVLPHTIDQVLALLKTPVPGSERLEHAFLRLENLVEIRAIPDPDSDLERALFAVLAVIFVAPQRSGRARKAVTTAVGVVHFELLTAFLAFVRTAHYWTETHPTLEYEADMVAVMNGHPELARLMLDTSEAEWAQSGEALHRALTDLQTTAGTLRTTEERFKALVTAISDVIYRMNSDWSQVLWLDGQICVPDAACPPGNWLTDCVHPEDLPQVRAALAIAVQQKSLFEIEYRVKGVDGAFTWTLSRAVPLLDESGNIIEWFGAARDVTARRGVDQALRDGDRHKNEFLATLAHELRNPLAPLRNGLEIAKKEIAAGSTFKLTIAMMDRQLNHLVHLVDDLLDVGRISTGKIELRRKRVRLREVLTMSVEGSRAAIDKHGHNFHLDTGVEELCVDGDFERLSQVFSNLLSNAAKYTERGGRIELRLFREGGEALVSVSDTGIGIPEAELPHVFDLFSQVREHQSRSEGGLGIGLALVRKLVEMHYGSVSATSAGVGKGSTFTVRLPMVQLMHAQERALGA